ncbi:MBL fold metallo-hydrolase [Sphingomonas rhizophila]|uniref:MBL fold metallo-hydrolase n=1 Tax=Sphingomonas rhizophila TaxID=2071607 RepID=A0A7G9SDG8_9SPHN|nr:MBL fold metallo-hydrolase [Sphingomonas rhizophila]QNN65893.1 MBL fold metallo-hydrolase [Sphingomonas rhizophila]
MKVRILGCGTSSGVPRIGNDWGVCDAADPRNRRSRSSILVESGGEAALIDCGPDIREQMNAADRPSVDRVIITHDHADHCHGIDDLRQVAQALGKPVPLYARADVLGRLEQRFGYIFRGTPLYPAVVEGRAAGELSHLGRASLRLVDQPHGGITSLGIRLDEGTKSLVYAIDFHDLTDDMATLYEGADHWICDCLRRRPHPTHAHLDAVLGWARELKVGALWLTHLDNSMDYATLRNELPDWAAPAFDGMEIGW